MDFQQTTKPELIWKRAFTSEPNEIIWSLMINGKNINLLECEN